MKKFRYSFNEQRIYFSHIPELRTAGYYNIEFNKYMFYEFLKWDRLNKHKESILYMSIIHK